MKPVLPHVFRAYDVRGIVDEDFDAEWVEAFGRACGTYFRARGLLQVVVGHDCRLSSPEYYVHLAAGLAASGLDVICLGMVATPVLYYAVNALGRRAGIMVTASHNPPRYNGFKIWAGETTIHTEALHHIYSIMAQGQFPSRAGVVCECDIRPSYVERLVEQAQLARTVKIVVDGGNGAGGLVCAEVLRQAGATVIPLYCEPDGRFPNHHPDPTIPEYMAELERRVVAEGADFGVGLDGDADRLGVVDEKGQLLHGDRVLGIFARDILASHPGATIIGEVKCSQQLYDDIAARGGRPIMAPAGHSLIKARLHETGALLGGEMSGHVVFADRYYGFDDAIYAALRLAEIVSASPRPVSALLADWPETAVTPELRLDCPDDAKFDIVAKAKTLFGKEHALVEVDGIRVTFPDGWGLVRASNTQPAVVLRFEAETPERLAAIRQSIEQPIREWIARLSA